MSENKNILIVEDDPDISMALSVRLESAGFQTRVAEKILEAMHLSLTAKPDLIILDIGLPDGDVISMGESFRTIPGLREVPIIILTASKNPVHKKMATELFVHGFFEKPYNFTELQQSIHSALAAT